MVANKKSSSPKKSKINVPLAIIKINVTFNNTLVSLTDTAGNVLAWATSGSNGFKGSRKSTPYAAQLATEEICRKAKDFQVKKVMIEIKGPGVGRESSLRAFANQDFEVLSIRDRTPIPHNGCRLPKRRRI
ncbi:MAG: small subunit ribosomal protein S11 [Alphaproteobacteria bacterium]|jgi:small subunit ribosomal protein S11